MVYYKVSVSLIILLHVGWSRRAKRAMKFAIPEIWGKSTDYSTNPYFCDVDPVKRRGGKNTFPVNYPDFPSLTAAASHNGDLTAPTLLVKLTYPQKGTILTIKTALRK